LNPLGSVAFVVEHPYVDALACFREAIKLLADGGWQVDVYTRLTSQHQAPSFERDLVRLIPITMTPRGALELVAALGMRRTPYVAIFTVPQWSLQYSITAAKLRRTPVVYISDEIITDSELETPADRSRKERERRDHAACAMTIALSSQRGEVIRQENRLPRDHPIIIVPNSAPAPSQRLRSHYYEDTLGLPPDTFIALHAGGLGWRPTEELLRVAAAWGAGDPMLVMQGRLHAQVAVRRDEGRVRFARTTLPSQLLDYAVSSAHVGLALYDDRKLNDRVMGTASGKLNLYLKNALPVITTALDCFDFVERSGVGVRVRDVAEVPQAIDRIRRDYDGYVQRVRSFYDANLDFAANFAPVVAALEQLKRGRRPLVANVSRLDGATATASNV
jgi:hypothetical protein